MLAIEKKAALSNAEAQQDKINPRWLKVPAAALYSGICRSRIYELLNAGKVRSSLIGAARLVDRLSLDDYIESCSVPAAA